MSALHFEFLLEEASMAAFLDGCLPRILPQGWTFKTYSHRGKTEHPPKAQEPPLGLCHMVAGPFSHRSTGRPG